MASRLMDVWLPFHLIKRLATTTLQLGYGFARMIYVTIGTLYGAIVETFKRCKSLCAITILTFRVVVALVCRVGFVIVLHLYSKAYAYLRPAITGFVLRITTCLVKPYHYQPLNEATSEIRLLKVQSVADTWGLPGVKLVKADLISVPIASAPPFAAVSYRWTYSSPVSTLLGHERFAMSSSICELLSALQSDAEHFQEGQLLWIDSICINQTDHDEKSWQIGLMKDIYSSAVRVIGWLSSDTPPVSEWRGIDGARDVAVIVSNDFFFRTWIVQEVALAQRLVMYTRHDTCLWDEGVLGIARGQGSSFSLYGENQMGIPSHMMTRLGHGIKNMNSLNSFRALLRENPDGIPLGELLTQTAEFQCTDPRDRIFGLLGLTTKTARSNILVNYSDTYSEIDTSLQAARFSIWGESSFKLLEMSGIGLSTARSQPGLSVGRPSWVPAWQAPHIPRMKETVARASSHKTATHLTRNIDILDNGTNSNRSLCIEGAIADSVKYIMTATWHLPKISGFSDEESLTQVHQFLDHLNMVCGVARGDQSPPSGVRNVHDAIMRTIMQGGSQTQVGEPNFEEIRLSMEQISQKLRTRLSSETYKRDLHGSVTHMDYMHFVMGLEDYMPLIIGRKLCTTEQGRFAIVPAFAEVGDEICALSGAPNPFVLRLYEDLAAAGRKKDLRTYQLVGVACVDGIMAGELQETDLKLEMFHII